VREFITRRYDKLAARSMKGSDYSPRARHGPCTGSYMGRVEAGQLACAACANTLEELSGRHPERRCELGDSADTWLALAALDLGDVCHVEVGVVSQALLA
jgi:hypothetical protein